jgi:hypothetical protein
MTGKYNREFYEFFLRLLRETFKGLPFEIKIMTDHGFILIDYVKKRTEFENRCVNLDFEDDSVFVGKVLWKANDDGCENLLVSVLEEMKKDVARQVEELHQKESFLEKLSVTLGEKIAQEKATLSK